MFRRTVLWGVVSLLPLAAAVAEDLPPRAGDARQTPRAERREKLRRLGGQLFDALVPPAGATQPVDVERLNQVLADLLSPLASAQGSVESIELELLPDGTDLAADKAAVRAAATLRHSVWSPEPSRLELTVLGHVEANEAGLPVACVEGQALLETEVLPLANFALARARDRLAAIVEREHGEGEPTFAQLAYEKLGRTGRLTTLDELADVLIYLAGLQLQAINDEIESLQAALAEGPEEPVRSTLLQRLRAARERRDRLFEMRPRIERDEAGVARAVVISVAGNAHGRNLQIEQLEIAVTEHSIRLGANVRLHQGAEWYVAFKPLVLGTLARLQAGDAALLNSARALRDQWQQHMQQWLSPMP